MIIFQKFFLEIESGYCGGDRVLATLLYAKEHVVYR